MFQPLKKRLSHQVQNSFYLCQVFSSIINQSQTDLEYSTIRFSNTLSRIIQHIQKHSKFIFYKYDIKLLKEFNKLVTRDIIRRKFDETEYIDLFESHKVSYYSVLWYKLNDLPNEILTEISNYYCGQNDVYNLMRVSKRFYWFLYDDPECKMYGGCCKHVIYRIEDEDVNAVMKMISSIRHFVHNMDLGFCSGVNDDVLKRIRFVKILNLERCYNVRDEGLLFLTQIHQLDLYDNINITGGGFVNFKNIHTLNLRSCYKVVDESLKYLKNVHTLNLEGCTLITDKGLSYLEHIYDLNVSKNFCINGSGFANSVNIHTLNLRFCRNIIDDSLKYLKNVHTLNLSGCFSITDEGIRNLEQVYNLDLNGNTHITGSGFSNFKNIHMLNLESCFDIDNDSLKYLKNVHTLYLSFCFRIDDIGLLFLKNIHRLHIRYLNIEGSAFVHFKNLQKLDIRCCLSVDRKYLKELPPSCHCDFIKK